MSEELKNLMALRVVLNSGSFELKGDAVIRVAQLLVWLDARIDTLKKAEND